MKTLLVMFVAGSIAVLAAGCQPVEWKWPWAQQGPPKQVHPSTASDADSNESPAVYETSGAEPARTTVPEDGVGSARLLVNGEEITVEDVLDPIMPQLAAKAAVAQPDEYRAFAQEIIGARIWQLVNEVLVYRDAQRTIDERYKDPINKEIDRLIQDRINQQFDGREARFDAHLTQLGITRERVRELARRQVVVSQYLRMRFEEGVREPTREELLDYYQTHMADFQSPASAELYLIEVPISEFREDGSSIGNATAEIEARRKARETAERAREEVASGINFGAVARQYSHGLKASEGGAWGKLTVPLRGKYALPSERVFNMKSGELSAVIEGEASFFVVKAGEVSPARVETFEETQPEIRAKLKADRLREVEDAYLHELRDKANIQRWDEFKREVVNRIPRPASAASPPTARSSS